MRYLQNPGEIVCVHCSAGVNRSGTLAYAFLLTEGKSRAEALEVLNSYRIVTLYNDFFDCPWRENAKDAFSQLGSPCGVE
jgi:protein-tyrosine phosphatase